MKRSRSERAEIIRLVHRISKSVTEGLDLAQQYLSLGDEAKAREILTGTLYTLSEMGRVLNEVNEDETAQKS